MWVGKKKMDRKKKMDKNAKQENGQEPQEKKKWTRMKNRKKSLTQNRKKNFFCLNTIKNGF